MLLSFTFSGLIRSVTLINLQFFSVVKKSARHKRQCVSKTVFFHTSFTYFRMAEFLSVVLALLIAF